MSRVRRRGVGGAGVSEAVLKYNPEALGEGLATLKLVLLSGGA